ncbi:DEKNAAC104787, partial [Brettanomyces naardenensis]
MILPLIWLLLLQAAATIGATINSATACSFGTDVLSQPGFNAKFYSYRSNDETDYLSSTYLASAYTKSGFITQATGVTSPQFSFSVPVGYIYTSELYGVDVTVSNITIAYSGYFLANESGIYTFDMTDIDDTVMVWFGNGLSCCNVSLLLDSNKPIAYVPDYTAVSTVGYVYLEAGAFYPIRMTYINIGSIGALEFHVVTPSGKTISNFVDSVFQVIDVNGECGSSTVSLPEITTTTTWTHTTTSERTTTYRTTNSGGVTYTQTEVIVAVPTSGLSTITTPWTGTSTFTTTSKTIETDSNGSSFTTSVIVIDTPTKRLSTVTTPWTGTFTSTTTSETVETDSNGSSFTTSIVIVDTPTSGLSTITTPWTGTFTSTTTSETVETDSNGSPFTTSVVIVDTPTSGLSTITTPWT